MREVTAMTYEQMEILVKALGVIISLVITLVIKPYIDSKVSATEQAKLENYIKVGVRCAEQIYTPEEWDKKKEYVVDYVSGLLGNLVKLDLTAEEISSLIEGFVYELKKE